MAGVPRSSYGNVLWVYLRGGFEYLVVLVEVLVELKDGSDVSTAVAVVGG